MPDSPRVAARALHERATDVRSNIGIEESLDPVETCTRAREELGLCVQASSQRIFHLHMPHAPVHDPLHAVPRSAAPATPRPGG